MQIVDALLTDSLPEFLLDLLQGGLLFLRASSEIGVLPLKEVLCHENRELVEDEEAYNGNGCHLGDADVASDHGEVVREGEVVDDNESGWWVEKL